MDVICIKMDLAESDLEYIFKKQSLGDRETLDIHNS